MTIDAIMPGVRVLCAVSGGVDSMYLLHRMTALGAQRGFAVGCAHFNHGLRGAESDRDEAFVRAQCEKLGVPFYAGARRCCVRARAWAPRLPRVSCAMRF